MCEPGSGRGARVLCSEAGEVMGLRKGEGTGRTLKVKGAQRRPWRSRSRFQSGCARVAGICPQLEGVAHRPETLFPELSPYLSSHPQVSPALTLDGPYSLGTQEAYQGVERQDQLHREDHG